MLIFLCFEQDALWFISEYPDILKKAKEKDENRIFLTPNAMEFRRLWKAIMPLTTLPPMDLDESLKDEPTRFFLIEDSNHTGIPQDVFETAQLAKEYVARDCRV